LDVALHGGLPAGREDVAEEENLLVRDSIRHLDVRRVGERNAEIFRLPVTPLTSPVLIGALCGVMRLSAMAGGASCATRQTSWKGTTAFTRPAATGPRTAWRP
jgi:hypothetical protein